MSAQRWPRDWVWIALLGFGMLLGGSLAWLIAATRVVLPYDESFVGLTRDQMIAVNGRLLAFLAHDRVTLAGTMIAIGVLYAGLALHPMRRGERWAWRTMVVSGAFGFASFFLFLGFGYFDPLHALVTILLLPFFLLGLFGPHTRPVASPPQRPYPAHPGNNGQSVWPWGQYLFLATGTGLVLAGISLAGIGVTGVFVPEDFAFMGTTRAALEAASPRLVPLIAHDRAGIGGALVCNGLGVILTVLWGYRSGERWLWWTLLISGTPGFVAALGTHVAVGYTDLWHLTPGLIGALLYLAAVVTSAPVLLRPRAPLPRAAPGRTARTRPAAG